MPKLVHFLLLPDFFLLRFSFDWQVKCNGTRFAIRTTHHRAATVDGFRISAIYVCRMVITDIYKQVYSLRAWIREVNTTLSPGSILSEDGEQEPVTFTKGALTVARTYT